jgi:hypothetical protein
VKGANEKDSSEESIIIVVVRTVLELGEYSRTYRYLVVSSLLYTVGPLKVLSGTEVGMGREKDSGEESTIIVVQKYLY